MTISTTITKNSYVGDASTTEFTYAFKISDEDHIQVIIKVTATGAETVKTKTTHYTVAGVGNSGGGTITFTTGNIPASTDTVILRRVTTKTQGMDLIENDPLSANTLEDAIDKNLAITQELQEELDRSLKLSRGNTITSTEFTTIAADRASKVLAFDSSGELSLTQEIGTFQGNWATSTAYSERDIIKDTSNNNIYLCNTAHTSSGSQPISGNTDVAKWDLLVDAAAAATSATAAATSATSAATSATASATSATASATSATSSATQATNSANSATAAASSATSAATAQTAAEAALDSFDDVYLGAKSSAPTVDNDGDALTQGDLFYSTSANTFNYYTGSTWVAVTAGGITSLAADGSPQLGGDLDLNGNNIDFPTTANISDCLDEDTMSSDSATKLATQQSIKAYVDGKKSELYGFKKTNGTGSQLEDLIMTYTNGADDISVASNDGTQSDLFDESIIANQGLTFAVNADGELNVTV